MKILEQHLHDSGTGGYPLRDILDNLTDEDIEDSVKEYAREYAKKACESLRERIAENAEVCFNNGIMENPIVAKSIICNDGVYSINKDSILKTEIILP